MHYSPCACAFECLCHRQANKMGASRDCSADTFAPTLQATSTCKGQGLERYTCGGRYLCVYEALLMQEAMMLLLYGRYPSLGHRHRGVQHARTVHRKMQNPGRAVGVGHANTPGTTAPGSLHARPEKGLAYPKC